MNTAIETQPAAQPVPKVTLRLWKGRLCIWPGNQQRNITKDANHELVVKDVHAIRLVNRETDRALGLMEPRIKALLEQSFAIVLPASDLPSSVQQFV